MTVGCVVVLLSTPRLSETVPDQARRLVSSVSVVCKCYDKPISHAKN